MLKKLIVALVILSNVTVTQAGSKVTCDDVITACNTALDAKSKEIELSDLALQKSRYQTQLLVEELADMRTAQKNPLNGPVLPGLIGLVVGGFLMGLVLK